MVEKSNSFTKKSKAERFFNRLDAMGYGVCMCGFDATEFTGWRENWTVTFFRTAKSIKKAKRKAK